MGRHLRAVHQLSLLFISWNWNGKLGAWVGLKTQEVHIVPLPPTLADPLQACDKLLISLQFFTPVLSLFCCALCDYCIFHLPAACKWSISLVECRAPSCIPWAEPRLGLARVRLSFACSLHVGGRLLKSGAEQKGSEFPPPSWISPLHNNSV